MSSRVEFSSRVVESSFSTWSECSGSTSQFDSTLFQKNFNSTRHFSSWVLDSNSSTRLDAISLEKINAVMKHYLWIFINYMQNDWTKWLFKVEFIVNNTLLLITLASLFLINLSQNLHLNFKFFESLLKNLIF